MPRARAVSSALPWSREAIATTSTHSPFCMAGITFLTPIPAVLRTPQRTLLGIPGHDNGFRVHATWSAFLLAWRPHRVALLQKGAQPLTEISTVADFFVPSHGSGQ